MRPLRQQIAESGIGVRERVTVGGDTLAQGDADIPLRDHYFTGGLPLPPPTTPLSFLVKPNTSVDKNPRQH